MRFSHLLLASALLGFGSNVAMAQPHGMHMHGGDMLTHGLTLTDAQTAQIKSIHKAAWEQAKATMKQERALHEQIETEMLTAGTTEADLTPLLEQTEALRTQLDKLHLATELQVRAVLTPAQLSQAATLHQQMQALHAQEHALMKPAAATQE